MKNMTLINAIIWLAAGICFLVNQALNLTKDGATFDFTNGLSILVCILCFVNAVINFVKFIKNK